MHALNANKHKLDTSVVCPQIVLAYIKYLQLNSKVLKVRIMNNQMNNNNGGLRDLNY